MAIEMTRYLYLDELIDNRNNGLMKIITGIARCGKSYLVFNTYYDYLIKQGVGESHIIELPLKDRGYKRLCDSEILLKYIESKIEDEDTYYIFINELNLIKDYDTVIKALLNRKNADVYITGGDNVFLRKNILEAYDIDTVEIQVSPLCYRELVEAYNGDKQLAMKNYLTYGGMPMVSWMNSPKEKKDYLYKILSTKYLPEIVDKYSIKNVDEFVTMLRFLADNIGLLTNPLQIENAFLESENWHITDKTAKNYISYLLDEMLLYKVLRYDIKKRKIINTPAKYYFVDIGLANTFLDFENLYESQSIENVIFNELMLRGYKIYTGVIEYNYREDGKNKKKQLEVDFMAIKGDQRYYIQLSNDEDYDEKHKNLMSIKDSFKKIIVVESDVLHRRDDYGIMTIGLTEFLYYSNSLEM